MGTIRKKHSASLKAKVALEAVKEDKTISQLASDYDVHPNQIRQCKKRLLSEASDIFSTRRDKETRNQEGLESELYRQRGQLKVELDWLKKKLNISVEQKKGLVEPAHPEIVVARQCPLPDYSHIAFHIAPEDFQACVRRLQEAGCEAWQQNHTEGDSFYFLDPDGHKLEIHCTTLAERAQDAKRHWGESVAWYC